MIVLYKGARGRGKTLTMVKDAYKFKQEGYRILTNLDMSFGEFISNEEILRLDKESNIKNAVILIDEIQIFFDNRRSMKKTNIDFSNFVQQIRKRNVNILCTSQYSNTIDKRLLQHLDFIALPSFHKDLNVCEVTYMDITGFEDSIFQEIDDWKPKIVKVVYDAKPIFKMYKTEQMIT